MNRIRYTIRPLLLMCWFSGNADGGTGFTRWCVRIIRANTQGDSKNRRKTTCYRHGTSRTFDASGDVELLARLQQVTQTFFDMGGGMIDSSPMYGSAQQVIGQLLPEMKGEKSLFAATKVWVDGKKEGIEQMEKSRQQRQA